MAHSANPDVHFANTILRLSMFLTMGISLILVFEAAYSAPDCPQKRVLGVVPTGTKTYYTFTDGTAIWSENGFRAGEAVCVR